MTFQIPCPAEPGMALNEVDTPALLLDLDAFDSNLQRLGTRRCKAGRCECVHTQNRTNARRLDCDKWHTERSVCAVRKSPKLKQWSQAGFPM
jgi:hypothetical protein